MQIHLIDATYELFRSYFGAPPKTAPNGREVGATVGLLRSLLALIGQNEKAYLACAFDHVIESFRNDLYFGYKTSEGIEPKLFSQFHLAEAAVGAMGIVVWPMIEFEADDALAAAAAKFAADPLVERVLICSPDKDLAQCVVDTRVVCLDRRRNIVMDASGVVEKFGVTPESIPDWLALVGDAADGYPGIPGWGAKSAATVLSRFCHLEEIPNDVSQWGLPMARAVRLKEALTQQSDDAVLYRRLATLRRDVPLSEDVGDLEWRGARQELKALCEEMGEVDLIARIPKWL